MAKYKVGYIIGSLSKNSINRKFTEAFIKLAPEELELFEIEIKDLPVYTYDYDPDYPPVGRKFKQDLKDADAVLWVTPEYNRAITAAIKNAIEWGSHPSRESELERPSAIVSVSYGAIGGAVAQSMLREILVGNAGATVLPGTETYIDFSKGIVDDNGEIVEGSRAFLTGFWTRFADFIKKNARNS